MSRAPRTSSRARALAASLLVVAPAAGNEAEIVPPTRGVPSGTSPSPVVRTPSVRPSPAPALDEGSKDRGPSEGITYFDVHRTLGWTALGAFGASLVVGAASGNLGRLTDPVRCCVEGGRVEPWRTVDRVLVNVGIFSYAGAAGMAIWNLTVRDPPGAFDGRDRHRAHRWLALAHGAAFLVSAASGTIMARTLDDDPEAFARAARVHVAANLALVPLLSAAMADVQFD